MKYLLAILLLYSTVSASVRNTGTTTRDSVCIYVTCLDSTGKPATCDSFYVRVIKSGSNAVAFSDSGTLTMTGMDSISGKSEYYYHREVADIDGTGSDGEYILAVVAKKTAGSGWGTPNSRIFEIQNNIVADSLILKRLGVYNTVASTTTNDYGAVEFSTTGDSSFAFVVKNTGIAGAKFKGSAFKLYSKTHSGILSIGGTTGSPTSGGLYLLDSSANGYGLYSRTQSGAYGAVFTNDGTGYVTVLGPTGGDIVDNWINSNTMDANSIASSELSDDAAREIASHILKDTTKRIGVKGGLGDSVLTPTPSVSASVTSLPDSVQSNIARHVWDRTADTTYPNKSWGDTVGKTALAVNTKLDSATSKVGVGDGAIGAAEIAADAITSSELATTAAAEIADAAGDSTWSATVTSVANRTVTVTTNNDKTGYTSSLTAGQFTKIADTTKGIMVSDTTAKLQTASTGRVKVDTVYKAVLVGSEFDSVKQSQAKIILGDTTKRVFSGLFSDTSKRLDSVTIDVSNANAAGGLFQTQASKILNDTTKRVKFSNDSVIAIDPIRTVVLTTPAPTLKQIRDTLIRAADTARIHVNDSGHVYIDDQWTDAQRDSIAARVLANRDTAHVIHLAIDTVRDTANADITLDRLQATSANLIKVIDSVNAILDTLQNSSSTLRSTGSGSGEVWTEAQRDSIIARVVKLRDSVQGILDTLQNLSSTLRLAGSDLDTVYQTVLCNDTIGGDFLLTLSDYRAQVKRKFGVEISNTTWMTDTVLNQLIREAIVTVNPIMRGYKTTKVMVSHFDSSDYPLDSLVGIASVLWHKDDTARSIPYLAREKWATLATQNTYGGNDPYLERPQVYDYTDALISFFPVPTSQDTIQINGWAKIPNITVVSSVAQIPQKYRIAILKYVTFLVARAKQHPLIQTYLDEYHESIMFLMERQNVKADSK